MVDVTLVKFLLSLFLFAQGNESSTILPGTLSADSKGNLAIGNENYEETMKEIEKNIENYEKSLDALSKDLDKIENAEGNSDLFRQFWEDYARRLANGEFSGNQFQNGETNQIPSSDSVSFSTSTNSEGPNYSFNSETNPDSNGYSFSYSNSVSDTDNQGATTPPAS